jgi:hypothetical protein
MLFEPLAARNQDRRRVLVHSRQVSDLLSVTQIRENDQLNSALSHLQILALIDRGGRDRHAFQRCNSRCIRSDTYYAYVSG